MKLLLTSGGVTTQAIADELNKMVGQASKKVAFVPTAANAEPHGDWFLSQLDNLRKFGFNDINFVDPVTESSWQEHLNAAGIIFVSGGNTFYLLSQTRKTGFDQWLKQNLGNKVYVGASAGSILVTPTIEVADIENVDRNIPELTDLTGLEFVDFEIIPHMPGMISQNSVMHFVKSRKNKIYCLNDRSAIAVVGGRVEVINDGEFWEYN